MDGGKDRAVEHGGGLDLARARWGGARADWLDLSTGINPNPYPIQGLTTAGLDSLPDLQAEVDVTTAARQFWQIPDGAEVAVTPGLSSVIAILPHVVTHRGYAIREPCYNEYERSFSAAGGTPGDDVRILVHPNNPDGALAEPPEGPGIRIIDESFCDTMPERSLIALAREPDVLVLKSFGKFWGLAGLRLGFAIGDRVLIARLKQLLGPWPVSGPALAIGTHALSDPDWAATTRDRLKRDSLRLDALLEPKGARLVGGTPLFRLYQVDDAQAWHENLARRHILTRIFSYSRTWLRVGLPPESGWNRLEAAL